MKTIGIYVLCGIILISFIVGIIFLNVYVKKRVNYNMLYKKMVEQTIREMVKPEYLQDQK